MTTRQFNESVNADIRRMTNKAKLPTSFSEWLASNNDSIEPLDRTEATAQWFDERQNDFEQKP